jgi:hypothetical protein
MSNSGEYETRVLDVDKMEKKGASPSTDPKPLPSTPKPVTKPK